MKFIKSTIGPLITLSFIALFCSCSSTANDGHLETVPFVDVQKYMGTWYEIAKFPNSFQKDCLATKAQYQLRDDGRVTVLNSCFKKKNPSELKEAKGLAKVVDQASNAKLKVTFTPFFGFLFSGDYWILALDSQYKSVLVGEPSRRYLWILSRTPTLPQTTIDQLTQIAAQKGFDVNKLTRTPSWIE